MKYLAILSAVIWMSALSGGGFAQSVTQYHGAADRSGHYVVPGLTWERAAGLHPDTGFHGAIHGHVYAQPLYWAGSGGRPGLLIVATESNDVFALNAETGAVVWRRTLGSPVALTELRCGNIDPLGVTGTPVIDPQSQRLYLDALVNQDGPRHLLFALSLADGSVVPGWPLDVAARAGGFDGRLQGERGALTIAGRRLYVAYAGNWGDCGPYRGAVVGVDLDHPSAAEIWQTRGTGGGIWAQGGVVSDGASLFVATGNTKGANAWSDGEAVIRLRPGLAHATNRADYFAPADWKALDRDDLDLGGTAPLPLDVPASGGPQHRLLALGKDGKAYLLDRADLGGIGGQLAATQVSGDQIRTAPAAWSAGSAAMVAFQATGANCPARQEAGGLTALRVIADASAPITTAWCAAYAGTGAPIVTTTDGHADPIVWIVGAEGDRRLHGYRGTDGAPLSIGGDRALPGLRRYQTVIAANRRIYVAADDAVYAFAF